MKKNKKLSTISDLNMKLMVPYNYDPAIVPHYIAYKKFIKYVYFGPDHAIVRTAGASMRAKDLNNYAENTFEIMKKFKNNKIEPVLVLNATDYDVSLFEKFKGSKLEKHIAAMVDAFGLSSITIATIPLARAIAASFPNITFNISANAVVNSLEKLQNWQREKLKIVKLCIPMELNRNLKTIDELHRNAKVELILLTNVECLGACPNREYHHNRHAHGYYEERFCQVFNLYEKEPWAAYHQCYIPPFELPVYAGKVNIVKIAGRTDITSRVLSVILSYIYGIDEHNPITLQIMNAGINKAFMIPPDKLRKILKMTKNCNRYCKTCAACEKMYKENIKSIKTIFEKLAFAMTDRDTLKKHVLLKALYQLNSQAYLQNIKDFQKKIVL